MRLRLPLKPRGGRQYIMGFTLLWMPPAPAELPE